MYCLFVSRLGIMITIKNKLWRFNMATAIKETPVLTGKNAQHFLTTIKENEQKKVPKEDYVRAKKAYKKFKIIGYCQNDG